MIDAIDVFIFAGGMGHGFFKAGFDFGAKRELPGGFGALSVLHNLDHYTARPGDFDYQDSNWERWTAPKTTVVVSNPPCSAWSSFTHSSQRGMDSPLTHCTRLLAEYAAKCDPEVVVFESVSGAYKQGRPLLIQLRARLEELTGHRYELHHVVHNAIALGGPAVRRRYFWVASRPPFGVEPPAVPRIPTWSEVVSDLTGIDSTELGDQAYGEGKPSKWVSAQKIRRPDGAVDGHITMPDRFTEMIADLAADGWEHNQSLSDVAHRLRDEGRARELVPEKVVARWERDDWDLGWRVPYRWHPDRPAKVLTGSGCSSIVHPFEPRFITLREAYRLQGFPDSWLLESAVDEAVSGRRTLRGPHWAWPGKGVSVQAGEWIAGWVKKALEGEPGGWVGQQVGDREWLTDSALDWKQGFDLKTGMRIDSRSAVHKSRTASRVDERVNREKSRLAV